MSRNTPVNAPNVSVFVLGLALAAALRADGQALPANVWRLLDPTTARLYEPNVVTPTERGATDALTILLPVGRVIVVAATVDTVKYWIREIPYRFGFSRLTGAGGANRRELATTSTAGWMLPIVADPIADLGLKPYTGPHTRTFATSGATIELPRPSALGSAASGVINFSPESLATARWRSDTSRAAAQAGGTAMPRQNGLQIYLEVPVNMKRLTLKVIEAGDVIVQDFAGELTISTPRGDVLLGRIGGSALVEANEGDITATVSRTSKLSPISLMSAKGQVGLWLTREAVADVELAPLNGKYLTETGPIASVPPGVIVRVMVGVDKTSRVLPEAARVRLRSLQGNIRLEVLPPSDLPRWPREPPKE